MMEQFKRARFRGGTALHRGAVAALDIGASSVKCLVADYNSDGGKHSLMHVLGFGQAPTKGIKDGAIVDMTALGDTIRMALDQAEKVANKDVRHAYIGVSLRRVDNARISGAIALGGEMVTPAHIIASTQSAHAKFVSTKHDDIDLMHVITIGYSLDDAHGIIDPSGMYGNVLQAHLYFITTPSTPLRNLSKCVEDCNLECLPPLLTPYVSALATLSPEEKDLGVLHIDMGGDTTAVSLFCNGVPFLNTVLPIGGNQITSDIARTLNIALSSAERVKKVHGSALAHTSSIGGTRAEFQAKCATGDTRNFSCHALSCIIRPLIEDIFTNIDNYLVQHQPYAASIGRVVLTGGAAQLSGVPEVARIILKRDTRLATPNHISGLPDIASHSDSAACVGLLQHAQNAARDVISAEDDQLISKVAHWLERYI